MGQGHSSPYAEQRSMRELEGEQRGERRPLAVPGAEGREEVEDGACVVPREQYELGRARHAGDRRIQPLKDLADERAGAETGHVAVIVEGPFLVCRLVDDLLLQLRGEGGRRAVAARGHRGADVAHQPVEQVDVRRPSGQRRSTAAGRRPEPGLPYRGHEVWRERRGRHARALHRRGGAGGAAVRALERGAEYGAGHDRIPDATERRSEDDVHRHDRRGAAVRCRSVWRRRQERRVALLEVGPARVLHLPPRLHELAGGAGAGQPVAHIALAEEHSAMPQDGPIRSPNVPEEAGRVALEFGGVVRPGRPVIRGCSGTVPDQHVDLPQRRALRQRGNATCAEVRVAVRKRRGSHTGRGDD
eukprot:scaffold131132_cov69-Phaeocystis_antarctica.AAC.5